MNKMVTGSLVFLAAGILTSVTILSVYQILFAVPLAYYLYLTFKAKSFDLPKSAWWLLAFMVVALLSLIVNFEVVAQPAKNFGRLKYYLYGVAGIFVFRAWLKDTSDKTKKIVTNVFLTSIIVAGVYATAEKFITGNERAKSLTDTMRYGYGSAMLLATLLSAILHRKRIESWFNWKLGLFAFVCGFLGMYLTLTRGALLGFLCSVPFIFYFYKPKLGFSIGGIAVLIVAVLGSFYFFGNVKRGHGSRWLVSKDNRSDGMRRSQWQAAVIAIKERPILGWGLSNFHSQLKRIKEENDLEWKSYDDAHAHNLFLEIGSGTGLIGLFIFLGWLITWAWECYREGDLIRAFVIPFGVAFVVGSQFEVTFDANNASMIFFLYPMSIASLRKRV